ncbi:DUF948 domain-containing protein [Macrococcus brunensis]|uniref:DUF948 domain-containing protein n=1 Tax=Macrococcus brunensis TaxID=198483 RepID=A0A4R6BFP4_9STAP|nr:DUF948 domain-containing protein [Macrococcus brunensis]TDL98608.1 DUF948 domain-containing protein [Macrococcus brunensis]ULG73648.1 DUF948 domain-containing protein [Macrococcus brunensis]
MEWILPIAGIIAAIAFLILCIGIVIVLLSVKKNLDHVAKTLDGVEGQIQGITRESTDLLHKTNRLAEDVQDKSARLNTVVDAVQGIGGTVNNLNSHVDRVTTSITQNIANNKDQIAQVVQWSNVAMEVADKWKMRKERRNAYDFSNQVVVNNDKEVFNNDTARYNNVDEDRINAGLHNK